MSHTTRHAFDESCFLPPFGGHASPRVLVDWPSHLVAIAALTLVYFVAARLGLSLAPLHKNVSLVWPPTGIALAALCLCGPRVWPGIALGAFLANAATGVGAAVSAGIALGNTLESVVAVYLLRRFTRFRASLERPQDVLDLVVLAASVSTTMSATIGVTSLSLGHAASWTTYTTLWWQWWLADAMGALIVAPVLLIWAAQPSLAWRPRRLAEGLALFALVIGVSQAVFGGWFMIGGISSPPAFAVFPFIIWAAMRFGQRVVATTTLAVSAIATWNTAREVGPFTGRTPTENYLLLQVFMSVMAVTALVLGAAIGGRRRVEEALQQSERRYRELFENATAVVYTADLNGRFTSINKRGEELTGYARDELLGMALCDLVTPAYVALAARMTEQQAIEWTPLQYEVEITDKAGRIVALDVATRLIADDGVAVGMQGVARDVTHRKQTERALEEVNEKLTAWVDELEARTRQMTLLSEMGDLLQSCFTADEAYVVIAGFIPKLFPSESGALGVLGTSRNLVEVVASWGATPPGDRLFAPDKCWALRRGRIHRVEMPVAGLLCAHVDTSSPGERLCVPMMAHGEPLGVLHLHALSPRTRRDGTLSESKQRLAVTVAEHIGLALANLRLRDTLRSQSIQDPLTGLFNRRYMEETLDLELARASRAERPVAIIMLDLDHFKSLNDASGHEAGDALLRELAGALKARVREGDVACRYGGEEFVLILPEAPLQLAKKRALELRDAVKRLRVSHRSRLIGPVTASFGVAAFPDHGKNGASLLQAADAALYQAKADGRDCVRVAE